MHARTNRDALIARRTRLVSRIGDRPALFSAGASAPRNYAANTFPFRAGSHFLYLVGLPLEHAFLLIEGEKSTLFVPEPTDADALWHGETASLSEIGEATGCNVVPLPRVRAPKGTMTLAAIDLATCERQSELVGRSIRPGVIAAEDLPLADAMIALRLHHDAAAIAELREGAETTTLSHLAGMRATKAGRRESEVVAAMTAPMTARGVVPAYNPIVTTRGEVLHNHAHGATLAKGDLLLCDVGAESGGGWACDVTRTWPVSGNFSTTQRVIYDLVLAAQTAAIEAVRPGVGYRDVHLTSARVLTKGLVDLGILRGDVEALVADGMHALFFPHGVGHLIGLDVHDMEDLGDRAGYAEGRARSGQFGLSYLRLDRDLEASMAVTIEPGFYQVPAILRGALRHDAGDRLDARELEKFKDVRGIRIEDTVLVTADGAEVLTREIPKDAGAVAEILRSS